MCVRNIMHGCRIRSLIDSAILTGIVTWNRANESNIFVGGDNNCSRFLHHCDSLQFQKRGHLFAFGNVWTIADSFVLYLYDATFSVEAVAGDSVGQTIHYNALQLSLSYT